MKSCGRRTRAPKLWRRKQLLEPIHDLIFYSSQTNGLNSQYTEHDPAGLEEIYVTHVDADDGTLRRWHDLARMSDKTDNLAYEFLGVTHELAVTRWKRWTSANADGESSVRASPEHVRPQSKRYLDEQ